MATPPQTQRKPLRLFLTADAVGGVFTYAIDLASGLVAHGVETTLAVLGPAAGREQREAAARVPGLTFIDSHLPLDWLAQDPNAADQAAIEVASLARWHKADVVHLNTPSLACATYDRPVVVALHSCLASWWDAVKSGPMPEDFRWRTGLTARGLRCADAAVCPSEALAAEVERLYGRRPIAVPNGRAMPGFPATGKDDGFVFATGRLWDEGKDLATLAIAAPMMDLPVVVAGPLDGPNGTRAEASHVATLGPLSPDAVRQRLAERPIFVAPALYEPFGLGVLEAAQAGCALVLADIPTFRELWSGAAIFVSPRDAAGFATAVNRLHRRPDERHRLGAAARERAGRYSVAAMARRMMHIYAGLLAGRKGAAA